MAYFVLKLTEADLPQSDCRQMVGSLVLHADGLDKNSVFDTCLERSKRKINIVLK